MVLATVVLPCRNEAAHIDRVIADVPSDIELICVNNNSSDETLRVLDGLARKRPGMRVLDDPRTNGRGVGYGFAHQTGMRQAAGEFIAGADGDGTYPVDKIHEVIAYMNSHGIDMVSCNRYPSSPDSTGSKWLQFGSWLIGRTVRSLFRVELQDSLSGMWVIRRSAYDKLILDEEGWEFSLQVKLEAALHPEVVFAEYRIVQKLRLGSTKQRYLQTGLWLFIWTLQRWRRQGRQPMGG